MREHAHKRQLLAWAHTRWLSVFGRPVVPESNSNGSLIRPDRGDDGDDYLILLDWFFFPLKIGFSYGDIDIYRDARSSSSIVWVSLAEDGRDAMWKVVFSLWNIRRGDVAGSVMGIMDYKSRWGNERDIKKEGKY